MSKSNTVTGHRIKSAITLWEGRQKALVALFAKNLTRYPEDAGQPDPKAIAAEIAKVNAAHCALLAARARYNNVVAVWVGEQTMSLLDALVALGPAGQLAKMWAVALNPKESGYGAREFRSAGEVYPVAVLSHGELLAQSEAASRKAAQIREAIAAGNMTPIDASMIGLDLGLLL